MGSSPPLGFACRTAKSIFLLLLGLFALGERFPRSKKNAPPTPNWTVPVRASKVGYVQHIDMPLLDSLAEGAADSIYVQALPGTFVDTLAVLALTAVTVAMAACGESGPQDREIELTMKDRQLDRDPLRHR